MYLIVITRELQAYCARRLFTALHSCSLLILLGLCAYIAQPFHHNLRMALGTRIWRKETCGRGDMKH